MIPQRSFKPSHALGPIVVGKLRFEPGQRWEFSGVPMRFERALGDDLLQFTIERTQGPLQLETPDGIRYAPNHQWAIKAFAEGRLRRLNAARHGLSSARRQAEEREYAPDQIAELDKNAELRAFVLRDLDRIGHVSTGKKAIGRALDRMWDEQPEKVGKFPRKPSPSSVRRWMIARGAPGERPMRQMMSMSGRVSRRRRLPPAALALLQRAALFYWSNQKATLEEAHDRLAYRCIRINRWRAHSRISWPKLQTPGQETLRKEIRRLECHETYATKFGKKSADARFKPTGEGLKADRFLQLGCMDHTYLDTVAVIDAEHGLPIGRPWVTVLIDVRTRCVVGFVLSYEPPSLYSVMECIKRANAPKLHLLATSSKYPVLAGIFGRFDEIVVDNGWELVGKSFEDGMADVGTAVRWAPVAKPTYKAIVERFFGTLNTLVAQKLPGGVLPPHVLRELGYDPRQDAVLTIAEIEDLIWEALRVYHIDLHTGAKRPPADLWQQDMEAFGGVDVIDPERLERMAGAMKYPCTLTRSGIETFGLQYHDETATGELLQDLISDEPARGQRRGSAAVKVKIKYNPANLAKIHVWNQRRNTYVTLPCTEERYSTGISLSHHEKLQEWTKQKGLAFSSEEDRITARAKLAAKIRQSAPNLVGKERKAAARLLSSPRVQETLSGNSVVVAYANARHDGLAPVIPNDTLADHRVDGDTPPSRRPRGGRKPKATALRSSAKAAREALPEQNDVNTTPQPRWKGFSK